MRKHRKSITPLVMLAAASAVALAPPVLAVALAPPATASSNPVNCRDSGAAKVCNKTGHSSLHAEPTVRQPQGQLFSNAWLPGYGRGHLPPLLALD